jgi:hypothetical protein
MLVVRMASLLLCLPRRNIAVAPTFFASVIPSWRMIGDSVNVVVAILVALLSMLNVALVLASVPVPICVFVAITIMISVAITLPLPVALCLCLIRSCLGLYFFREFHRTLCPGATREQQYGRT